MILSPASFLSLPSCPGAGLPTPKLSLPPAFFLDAPPAALTTLSGRTSTNGTSVLARLAAPMPVRKSISSSSGL